MSLSPLPPDGGYYGWVPPLGEPRWMWVAWLLDWQASELIRITMPDPDRPLRRQAVSRYERLIELQR
ncbi:hypothetical protein [Nonomuraea basaltis]|uniref:hypothetical protein n=1 Tax=Nonomuraea basaltis TaxID=2495887 RepID=UPI00110C473D|nr:hypothetical protein [Nonomuraea basaltis]TMR99097.1 hypothetical protein EJK15_09050 [Nonomuraea basaltis]